MSSPMLHLGEQLLSWSRRGEIELTTEQLAEFNRLLEREHTPSPAPRRQLRRHDRQ